MAEDPKPRPVDALINRVAALEAALAQVVAGNTALATLNVLGLANFQGNVNMSGLASSDPVSGGALYVSTGTVKQSAG